MVDDAQQRLWQAAKQAGQKVWNTHARRQVGAAVVASIPVALLASFLFDI